jgi:hypothetical protein
MKVEFEDASYIEVVRSQAPGKVMITILAKSQADALATVANSVELDIDQFNKLIQLEQ